VSRVESTQDRRIRVVSLTPRGKGLIVPTFRKHTAQKRRVFSELSLEELRGLEAALKKIGRRADALHGQRSLRAISLQESDRISPFSWAEIPSGNDLLAMETGMLSREL